MASSLTNTSLLDPYALYYNKEDTDGKKYYGRHLPSYPKAIYCLPYESWKTKASLLPSMLIARAAMWSRSSPWGVSPSVLGGASGQDCSCGEADGLRCEGPCLFLSSSFQLGTQVWGLDICRQPFHCKAMSIRKMPTRKILASQALNKSASRLTRRDQTHLFI